MSIDALEAKLTLTIKGESFVVPAGNLKHFSFEWTAQGFSAEAEWWLVSMRAQAEDTLFAAFTTDDLIEVVLQVEKAFDVPDDTSTPIVLKGLIVEKWIEEHAFSDIADAPVLQRRYGARFRDRLSVLWRQHFPCVLYTNLALKDVLLENLPEGADLQCSWPVLDKVHAVVALGLGQGERAASFYDFVLWLTERENGYLQYDADEDRYELLATRVARGATVEIAKADIADARSVFREPRRATPEVLNASTLAASKQRSIRNALGAAGITDQYLIRSSLATEFDARVALEALRTKQRKPELVLGLARYPRSSLWPATVHEFGQAFSSNLFWVGKTYWVRSLAMKAVASSQEPVSNLEDAQNTYETKLVATLEQQDDEAVRHAPFFAPTWPMHVEGVIVSDIGEADHGTYQIKTDADTSLDYYRVKIPLFADQEILATFDAGFTPGHFYFPAFRNQRVLVAFELLSARIVGFVDFRPDARLPADSQGNHLLMGKKVSDGTSFKHHYRGQKPVLDIQRVADKDTQLISVSDGTILLKTEEVAE